MAKEVVACKYDPNTEIFQMRAQWKKVDNCRKQWFERWSWLLDEQAATIREVKALKQGIAEALPREIKEDHKKSLKPIPLTSSGNIGWLATKPDCQLEIYTSWISLPPKRLPDAWECKDYVG